MNRELHWFARGVIGHVETARFNLISAALKLLAGFVVHPLSSTRRSCARPRQDFVPFEIDQCFTL